MAKQTEHTTEGKRAMEAIKSAMPGLSLSKILSDIGNELKEQGSHGSHELAAALFRGADAFVMYPRTNQADGPEQSSQETEHDQSRDGREL